MIVTAALSWWNEPLADLEAAVRSMANIADRVVALDGAYRRFPGATITSPPEQAEVIRRTAAEVGLECLVLEPDRLWAGQLEKRTYLYNLAAIGSDWIMVVDADHIIHAERDVIRTELAQSEADVVITPMRTPLNEDRPLEESAATAWHAKSATALVDHRLLFRAFPGIRVEDRHWWVSAIKAGERVWVKHDVVGEGLPALPFTAPFEIEHRSLFHSEERIAASRAFYEERAAIVEKTGQEDDLPGLSEHVDRRPFIVTAALIWWDERPDDLEVCIRGIATVADRLIAVDGAYQRYPNATVSSPPEQAKRIRKVAKEIGLECEIIVPEKLWAGQVEKRNFAYSKAAEGSDWIAIFDADWVASGDREAVRAELRSYGRDIDVVTASVYTPAGDMAATNWHAQLSGNRERQVHFLRPLPSLRVENLHWWISAIKDGQRVWMQWQTSHSPSDFPKLPHQPLVATYEVEHRTLLRDEPHVLASRAFCNDRVMVLEKTGQEDHMAGLPEPVFDYVTVPY